MELWFHVPLVRQSLHPKGGPHLPLLLRAQTQAMRRRWKDRFGGSANEMDDSPTSMPVRLPDEAESGEDAFCSAGTQFDLTGDLFVPQHSWDDFEHLESCALDANTFPPAFPGSFAAQGDTKDHVKFVDKGTSSERMDSGRYEKVSSAAPPCIVSEALRLTDKKTLLYPWEKGRLGRIFGHQGRLSLKKPRLNPGVNNFVNVGIGISDRFHLDGSVTVQPTLHDAALYKAVVKNIVGCTFT